LSIWTSFQETKTWLQVSLSIWTGFESTPRPSSGSWGDDYAGRRTGFNRFDDFRWFDSFGRWFEVQIRRECCN